MSADFFFFDLPVYRIRRDKYYQEMNRYIEENLFPPNSPFSAKMKERERTEPNAYITMREHLRNSFGGAWRYNEIIGYIRLHFLGNQIRGEYYSVRRSRIVRTRRKILEWQTWKIVPEIDIEEPYTNESILSGINEYIADCRKEVKGRFVDTDVFDSISRYID